MVVEAEVFLLGGVELQITRPHALAPFSIIVSGQDLAFQKEMQENPS